MLRLLAQKAIAQDLSARHPVPERAAISAFASALRIA
jgi:hypothetical protein